MAENTQHRPKVSIVMSFCKEPSQWIMSAVDSILSQTFRDFEFIIICDDPQRQDMTGRIMSIKDERILLIANRENLGLTKSLNKGIASSSGEYIARMDADDVAMKDRLARQVDFLDRHREVSVCATDVHLINAEGKIVRRNRYRRKLSPDNLFITNPIAHSSVMFRRDLLETRSPLYNEAYRFAQDYELWQHLILKGHIIRIIPAPLLLYRKSSSQISAQHRDLQIRLFREAHKSLITGWMLQKGIIEPEDISDLKVMLAKGKQAMGRFKGSDRRRLTNMIYILYYSISTDDWRYKARYIFDRDMIMFMMRPIHSWRLLFTVRRRRFRIGIS